jgi:hypothetical protein
VEKAAWKSLKNVTTNFLGNHKAQSYRDKVPDVVQSYRAMGCNMSLYMHFLGHTVAQLVEALRQKPESRRFDSR